MQRSREYTLEEVAEHATEGSCWSVVDGRVLDMTGFLADHPGGARSLLGLAGGDATAVFREIHFPNADYVELLDSMYIGRLAGAGPSLLQNRPDSSAPLDNFCECQLDTPFPSERFHGSGLEAVRFEWALLDSLIARDGTTGMPSEPIKRWGTRQKARVGPLKRPERDWLAVGNPSKYVTDMLIREQLFGGTAEVQSLVYCANRERACISAQREVLDMIMEWLPRTHPTRFHVDVDSGTVATTTPGYERVFAVADFASQPLRLCALLVQEDMFLMKEESAEEVPPSTVDVDYHPSIESHAEDHPSGFHHGAPGMASDSRLPSTPPHLQYPLLVPS